MMHGSETNLQASDTANMSTELGLDPSDPLNLLLQGNSADSESISSQGASPPDWSQFSALWPPSVEVGNGAHFSGGNENVKFSDFGMDFDLSVPMDLDFSNAGISIDPNALHFNKDYQQSTFGVPLQPHELYSTPFPFTFSSPSLSSASTSSEHTDEEIRTNIHSSAAEAPSMVEYYSTAVPQALAASAVQAKLPIPRLARPTKPTPTPKPVKRSTKSPSQPQSHVSSSASSSPSPGPSSPHSNSDSTQSASTAQGTSVIPRPKTSHTTIERRYRTNLNARIKSLRQAVPALRVLEQNNGGEEYIIDERGFVDGVKVARKGSKANVLGKAVEYIRVLKKREARLKREQSGLRSLICGVVGGAALLTQWEREWVEKYGGPEKDELDDDDADEASDDDDAEGDGEDEGDDEERARKKVKVAKVPAQKKDGRKTTTSAVINVSGEMMSATAGMVVPEKRKRGRPRKNPPVSAPPITASAPVMLSPPPVAQEANISMMQQQMHSQGMPPQQYLLAIFALFSFFKSPLASSMSAQHTHTHSGSVLSDVNVKLPASSILSSEQWTWNNLVQVVHLVVSLLVFATIVFPWLPLPRGLRHTRLMRLLSFGTTSRDTRGSARGGFTTHTSSADALPTPPASPSASDSESDTDSSSSTEELHAHSHDNVHAANHLAGAIATKGLPEEMDRLVAALGLGHGVLGLARGTFTMGRKRSKDKSVDRELVRRAWIRLGELFAMNVSRNTPVTARLQTYVRASSLLGSSAKSDIHYTSDLCTMALLARCIPFPFADSRAEALWNRAKAHESKLVQPYERLVLNSITLKEAATRLRETTLPTANSPLRALATSLVLDRVREHASVLFVRTVSPDEDVSGNTWAFSEQNDKRGEKDEEKRWRETISAGRSLGGQVGALVDAFAKAWQSGVLDIDGLLSNDEKGECTEIAALLNAIVLYRQVFPPSVLSCTAVSAVEEENSTQSILSPPPSPSSCTGGLVRVGYDKEAVLKLRRALGSSAFDFREVEGKVLEEGAQAKLGETLEETRDRVVDLLVEYERRGRGRICKFNVQEH